MAKTYSFTIPIGDWSNDGHGKCEYYRFSSNKPLKAVREAYFKAVKDGVAPNPEKFCNGYEEWEVPQEIVDAAAKLGYEIYADDFGAEGMVDYVAWFITQGDPEIKLKKKKSLNTLPFYGYDEQNRHIGFIGYGLLGS